MSHIIFAQMFARSFCDILLCMYILYYWFLRGGYLAGGVEPQGVSFVSFLESIMSVKCIDVELRRRAHKGAIVLSREEGEKKTSLWAVFFLDRPDQDINVCVCVCV